MNPRHPGDPRREVDVDGLLDLGCELADAGEHDAAVGCFRQAAALGSGEAMFNLGNSLEALGRVVDAVDAFRRAAELGVVDAWLNLGNALAALGDDDGAVKAYETAWKAGDPNGPLALAYEYRERDGTQAERVLLEAASDGNVTAAAVLASWRWNSTLDPSLEPDLRAGAAHHPEARADLADLLRTTGRLAEARAVLEEGVLLGEVESMLPLGNLYADDLGEPGRAEATYRAGIEAGDIHCHHNLAILLLEQGDREAAETHALASWRKR